MKGWRTGTDYIDRSEWSSTVTCVEVKNHINYRIRDNRRISIDKITS
jgi:hypothetical protein